MRIYLTVIFALLLVGFTASHSWAEGSEPILTEEQIAQEKEKSEKELEKLFTQITENPEDLDLNFKYATLANELGKYDEAIAAYERMLIVDPNLNRVKLDMALVYMKNGNFTQAKGLFEDVMGQNPPQTVMDNINSLMKVVRKAEKKHHFGGSVTVGFNSDSNATATPTTGAVDLFGVSIPLSSNSQVTSDDHRFISVAGSHKYILSGKSRHVWNSAVSVYKTHQSSLGNLNLTVISASTGPTFNLPKIRSKLGFELGLSETHLARKDYLSTVSKSVRIDHFLTPKVAINASWKRETKMYENTDSATTYETRNGNSDEQKLGALISLGKNDIITSGIVLKQDRAKLIYNSNRQTGWNLAYTHIFPKDYFMNAGVSLKKTSYRGLDTLVSPTVTRKDYERSFNLTLGKKLSQKLTLITSYQWRNIDSSIQNYAYKNERLGISLSYAF